MLLGPITSSGRALVLFYITVIAGSGSRSASIRGLRRYRVRVPLGSSTGEVVEFIHFRKHEEHRECSAAKLNFS